MSLKLQCGAFCYPDAIASNTFLLGNQLIRACWWRYLVKHLFDIPDRGWFYVGPKELSVFFVNTCTVFLRDNGCRKNFSFYIHSKQCLLKRCKLQTATDISHERLPTLKVPRRKKLGRDQLLYGSVNFENWCLTVSKQNKDHCQEWPVQARPL